MNGKIIFALQLAIEAKVSRTLTTEQCQVLLQEIERLKDMLDMERNDE